MKSLVILLFTSFAFADPGLLGTKECSYGPSYWCSHALNAKKCGAVQHCIDTVWKTQIIKPKDALECNICKIGITEAKEKLKQGDTEEKIKEYMNEVCNLLTRTDLKNKCTAFVKTDLPLLLQLLKSPLTPEQICATLKMCTGFEDLAQHQKISTQETSTKSADVCTDCTNFFTDIQNMIVSNETQEQIEAMLKQTLCSQLESIKSMCNFVVEEYTPEILQYLGQTVDPKTTCRILGFCDNKGDLFTALRIRMQNKETFKKFNKKAIGGQEECDVCKNVMTDVQSLDRDPTTQGKIKDFVKKELCSQLGGLASECSSLVDQYASVLFELLANELDPETVCSFVGFCRAVEMKQPAISVVSLTKSEPIIAYDITPAMLIHDTKPVKTSGVYCDICKVAMNELDSILAKNATTAQIEAALNELCDRLPGGLKDQCTSFINQYAPAILELLKKELNPTVVCDNLGLCTPMKSNITKPVKTSGVYCDICKVAMNELDSILAKNATTAQIEAALNELCDRLPGGLKDQCTSFINQYAPAILELLKQELNPTVVCDNLGLCTPMKSNIKSSVSAVECVLCEYVLSTLERQLGNNKSLVVIKEALDKVCSLMPSTISTECISFVNKYEQLIINLLLKEVKASEVCKSLGLCTASVKSLPKPAILMRGEPVLIPQPIKTLPKPVSGILLQGEPVMNKKNPVKSNEGCLVCETLMNYLSEALKENKTAAAIKSLLEKACNVLPTSMANECQGIVIAFGDIIIKELSQEIDPKQICKDIDMCPASKINNQLPKSGSAAIKEELKNVLRKDNRLYYKPKNLGKKKCGFGPSYWCKSMETAQECGMVEHCKDVWSRK
ncbi:prosaposin-like isoform X1 [Mytilus galloprovincialis]|uniref:prosaposin-like isoform X1 n=1 Tax=Mytilus galloprovincialis TaxID=29158 RepID=UPI003F7B8B5B